MRIDLHTHSRMSDGTQTPRELVRAAAAAGIDVLGLTDHDTTLGWDEAATAAAEVGVDLVRGIEISTGHGRGYGVHLLAYLPDPTFAPLQRELAGVLAGRNERLPRILERLADVGIGVEQAAVERIAGDAAAIGRPHIADAMVEAGHVADRGEAFRSYLNPGRAAYVARSAADLTTMIRVVREAGGATVIAHPWGRRGRHGLTATDLARLRGLGLAGIEVDHHDHGPSERRELRAIAEDLDLVITGSSDHHGAGKIDHDLGSETTAPEQYQRLLERAGEAARGSGRDVPAVLIHH